MASHFQELPPLHWEILTMTYDTSNGQLIFGTCGPGPDSRIAQPEDGSTRLD